MKWLKKLLGLNTKVIVKYHKGRISAEQLIEMAKLKKAGLSIEQIAERVNCGESTVYLYLRKLKLALKGLDEESL